MTFSLTDSCALEAETRDVRLNRDLLAKLRGLDPAAWADLLWAQHALICAQILLWTRPRGTLLARAPAAPQTDRGDGGAAPAASRLALAVERAAEHGLFHPTCLVQAIALQRMLTARGFTGSSVRVGVRLRGGRLLAHAWVDYRGAVMGDRAWRVREFDELARFNAVGQS